MEQKRGCGKEKKKTLIFTLDWFQSGLKEDLRPCHISLGGQVTDAGVQSSAITSKLVFLIGN